MRRPCYREGLTRLPSGHDIVLPIAGRDLCVEVKARADGFRELCSWLEGRDVLIVIAKPTAGR